MVIVLDKKLKQLDVALHEVFEMLDAADTSSLSFKPSAEKWSAVQILSHLQQAEQGSLSYLHKKVPEIDNQFATGFKQRYRSFLLKFFLATPLKFKAPAAFAAIPEDLDYEEVKKAYLGTRQGIREIMGRINEEHLNRAVMKHPRIGSINALQTLEFFASHFDHHRKQIEARLRA